MNKEKHTKSKALGKGLSSLLGNSNTVVSMQDVEAAVSAPPSADSGAIEVTITTITPGPWQPRRRFDDAAMKDLVTSISQHGVVQPLLVRPSTSKKGQYEMIAGERRWRAAQMAGLHQLPVIVLDADDKMAAEIALVENIQRDDLSVIEEAGGYRRLMEEFGYIQEDLAKIVGKSRSHLANLMRLLNLPDAVQEMLSEGKVTAGQVRPLIGHDDAVELAHIIASKGLSARQAETLVSRHGQSQPPPPPDANITALEKKLTDKHGLDISLKYNSEKGNGQIKITCKSFDQFDAMIALLGGKK